MEKKFSSDNFFNPKNEINKLVLFSDAIVVSKVFIIVENIAFVFILKYVISGELIVNFD